MLGIDLVKESKLLEQSEKSSNQSKPINISTRAFRVDNEAITKIPNDELQDKYWDKTSVIKIIRNGSVLAKEDYDYLKMGDHIYILAEVDYYTEILSQLNPGKEIVPETDIKQYTRPAQIVIINKEVIDKRISELQISDKYSVLLTGLKRMRIEIPLTEDTNLHKGDILTVTGSDDNINLLGKKLGHVERDLAETDMVTFAFGIAFGVLIGLLAVNIGQVSIGLGSAGGLLASGLMIGYLRSIKPTFGRMPDAARWILMEFGLLLFMAGVGLRAGSDIIETFLATGPVLVMAGIFVTIIPILIGYAFGRKVLKIHPVLLFGGITGSMTSGASLSVVTKEAQSYMPSLGYTGSYAFANVLLTVAGSIILFI